MELISLHPFDELIAETYVAAIRGDAAPRQEWTWWSNAYPEAFGRLPDQRETDAHTLTTGLSLAMTEAHPAFVQQGFGFTTWEARIDRGMGMLMRPPARALIDAGIDRHLTLHIPIRLDVQGGGMMGGSFVPARLISQLRQILDDRLERTARRIRDAEMDPYRILSLMQDAVSYAESNALGLIEALDIVQPGMRVIEADERKKIDPTLRARIDVALEGEKKPGFFGRLFGNR